MRPDTAQESQSRVAAGPPQVAPTPHAWSPPADGAVAPDSAADTGLRFEAHFQPITAVRRGAVLGVEALTRAFRADGTAVPPLDLFAAAERDRTVPQLDRACRRRAVERFAPVHRAEPTLICFVNCHVSTFLTDVDGPDAWAGLADACGVDRRAIAIEVLESQAADLGALARATARYREAGFLVVIDDVGAGHSNLDRVTAIRPDMLKADRSLVHGCAHDRVKRAVVRALVGLTEELGGWLVVEGIEDEADALAVLNLGADLLQGYFFARPAPLPSLAALDEPRRRTVAIAAQHRSATRDRVEHARRGRSRRAEFAREVAHQLAALDPTRWPDALAAALGRAPGNALAASAAVLDITGVQLTPTVRTTEADAHERTLIYHTPGVGTDHALKEYVYLLPPGSGRTFESPPYVPLPNEKMCVAVSIAFRDATGARRLLCAHLDADLTDAVDSGPPADSLGM